MTTEESLDLASTVELYTALAKRFDHCIFMGIQNRPLPDSPGQENRMRRWKGNPHLCTGLGLDIAHRVLLTIQNQETELPDDGL